jgi:hypothetical protein
MYQPGILAPHPRMFLARWLRLHPGQAPRYVFYLLLPYGVVLIRTGHWRTATYLKGIRKRQDDKSLFCQDDALPCAAPLSAREAKVGESGGKDVRGVWGVVCQSQVGAAVC